MFLVSVSGDTEAVASVSGGTEAVTLVTSSADPSTVGQSCGERAGSIMDTSLDSHGHGERECQARVLTVRAWVGEAVGWVGAGMGMGGLGWVWVGWD